MLAAILLTSCGVSSDVPTSCALTTHGGQADTCQQVVSVAQARLGFIHPPITAISALTGAYYCGEGCAIPPETWWVVFAFAQGDPVLVLVRWVGDTATAGEPGPVPAGMPVPAPKT